MDKSSEQRVAASYDAIPYRDLSFPFAHPRHLEAMAALFSLQPPPITSCRVLELGCAAGGNLIPQALDLPNSTFLGVDLSPHQIADGQAIVRTLNLKNIELRQANVMDIGPDWGQFDYIISHGLFSWVPPDVQDKLLTITADNLSPAGVALVSYNTYPGWHLAGMLRELMLYHTAQFVEPRKKIEQAQILLQFLIRVTTADTAFGKLLRDERTLLEAVADDSYLFHDHLEEHNHPLYFHEFMARAGAHGLQYLAEADFSMMLLRNMPPESQQAFGPLPILQQEQYIDFLAARRFRKTLLCHNKVPINRNIEPATMTGFHFSLARPLEAVDVDIRNESPAHFKSAINTFTATQRLTKAAMVHLREVFPGYVSFPELYRTALARIGGGEAPDPTSTGPLVLANDLLIGYSVDFLAICRHSPTCVVPLGPRPRVNPLVRLQAEQGKPMTSQRHEPTVLHPIAQQIVRRLDGSHGRRELVACVREAFRAAGEAAVQQGAPPVSMPAPHVLPEIVDRTLAQISAAGLLIG